MEYDSDVGVVWSEVRTAKRLFVYACMNWLYTELYGRYSYKAGGPTQHHTYKSISHKVVAQVYLKILNLPYPQVQTSPVNLYVETQPKFQPQV